MNEYLGDPQVQAYSKQAKRKDPDIVQMLKRDLGEVIDSENVLDIYDNFKTWRPAGFVPEKVEVDGFAATRWT